MNASMSVAATNRDLHDIWSRLTFDITWKILSQLDQYDIIELMAVCRAWCELVPQYSTRLFRSVTISGREQRLRLQKLKAKCLGPHVRSVIVVFHKGDSAFREDIEELEQLTGGSYTTAVLCYCSSYQLDGFLDTLRLLGNHLTRLIISHHMARNLNFYDVMAACPKLTYFEFEQPGTLLSETIFGEQGITYPLLTDLLLFGSLNPSFRLEPILAKCPNLRFLAFTESMWRPALLGEELPTLLRHCPKLSSVSLVDDSAIETVKDGLDRIIKSNRRGDNKEQQHGLGELTMNLSGATFVAVDTSITIAEHLSTLKSLKLQYCVFKANSLPDNTITSCMTTLEFRNVLCTDTSFIALISRCPLLEHLLIEQHAMSFTPELARAVGSLSYLQRLYLIPTSTDRMDIPRQVVDALDILFRTMKDNHIQLHTLHIRGRDAPIDDIVLESIASYLSFSSCTTSIQHLAISSPYCSSQGLESFTAKIRHLDHLLSLQLHHFQTMISKVTLSFIAELPMLERLVLMSCWNVSGEGLCVFVQRSRNLKSIRVQQCSFIDVMPWVEEAEKRLGSPSVYADEDPALSQPPNGFRDWLF